MMGFVHGWIYLKSNYLQDNASFLRNYILVGFLWYTNGSTKTLFIYLLPLRLLDPLYPSRQFTQIFPEQTDSIQSTSLLTVVRFS